MYNTLATSSRALAALIAASVFALSASFAFADATVLVQSLSPGNSVAAGTQVTFTAVPTGLNANTIYSVSDSFSGSTVTSSSINGLGGFYWTPVAGDAGAHTLTITASDNTGASATVTQLITVTGTPTVKLDSIVPNTSPAVGQTMTFTITPTSFPSGSVYSYGFSDTHPRSTITSSNVNSSGLFSWKPTSDELGLHTLTVTVNGGGVSAHVDQRIIVGDSGSATTASTTRSLTVSSLLPGASVAPGTAVTATLTPIGLSPNSYYLTDSFPGSSATYSNVSATGSFTWTPKASDIGVHTITFTAYGPLSTNASVTSTITVIGTALPTVTTPVVTSAPTYAFTSALSAGSTGTEVTALQSLLVKLGFLSATPSGTYGPATTAAVKAYQAARGLSALGNVGPGTRAALNAETGAIVSTPAATVTTTTSAGMSAATKAVLLQIALQLQQLAAQLSALAQ